MDWCCQYHENLELVSTTVILKEKHKTDQYAVKEVVVMLTDMVQYSRLTHNMRPEEIRNFIVDYHRNINQILMKEEYQPLSIDPSAGDGAIVIFDKYEGDTKEDICTRALQAAMEMAEAIEGGGLPPTRMGLFLGEIIEAQLGDRLHKFGSSFAVASRLEELCGYFGTSILMDREVARGQKSERNYLLIVGKITPKNFSSPFNLFTIFKPGINGCPEDVDPQMLQDFINMKNEAMELFAGNQLTGVKPNFPVVRTMLNIVQSLFMEIVGGRDIATERIMEYIRETPYPDADFEKTGMKIHSKKGNPLGARLYHLSKQLLRAIDSELYQVLVEDTEWERHFRLEWRKKGEAIVKINEPPDGVYYIDSGKAHALDEDGNIRATFGEGSIFGEMAYFTKEKRRNATVIAGTDLVVRKVSNEHLDKLPVIKRIFQRLAEGRQEKQLPY